MKTIYILVLFVCFSIHLQADNREVIIVNDSYPPYVNIDGINSASGIDIELAKQILSKYGLPYRVVSVPWVRALRMLKEGEADMTTTISYSDDREKFLDFSLPYRKNKELSFFVARDLPFDMKSLDDLKRVTLGLTRGFIYPDYIINNNQIEKKYLGGVEEGFKYLQQNRIRVFLVNTIVGDEVISKLNLGMYIQKLDYPLFIGGDAGNIMFGFSKKSKHMELQDIFNKEIGRD